MKPLIPKKIYEKTIRITDALFSLFIFVSIVALIIYTGITIFNLFVGNGGITATNIVHNIAYVVVLLKAYKILVFYLESHNLSIKYLVQISIIAPAIEVIFAAEAQPQWLSILFSIYSLSNLVVYLKYHKELDQLNISESENI